jgi:flagellar hook-associated protein 2
VTVSQSNGVLSLTSKAYGSTSNVQITGGNDPSYFFGTPASTSGQDVEGTINNVAAKGVGQSLIGAVGDQSEGLRVVVNGATGDRGTVTYTKGYASLFNDMLNQMLDTTGAVSTRTAGLNVTLTSMQKQADDMNTRLTALQAQYRSQYSALDSLLSSMNSTSTYLTQQLARLG